MELANKKGSVFFAIIIAIVIFMIGMVVVNLITPQVTSVRNDINCASPATDGTKLLCLVTDATVPYYILLVLSVSLGVITEKLLI